jgi:hypothetical protein
MRRPLRARLLLGVAVSALAWAADARGEFRFRALPDGSAIILPLQSQLPDGHPAGWWLKMPIASVTGGYSDPVVSVTVDPQTGRVRESYRELDVEVREPLVAATDDYNRVLATRTTRRLWREKIRSTRSVAKNPGQRSGLLRVELPVQLPKAVRSIVGDGAPNIEVSGSETITLAGISDWTVRKSEYDTERRRQSAFPSFEMKQELNVNLTGSIGDKIKVDVDQSSNVTTSLDNRVKLRYEGDEDDMIKSVDLGNTNLSLQGASIRQEGLFGVKTVAKLGNVDVTTIASKQEGKSETARFTPSGELTQVIVRDQDYIKRQYYFVTDHPAQINYLSLEIWKDDANGNNNNDGDAQPGYGRLDPRDTTSSSNPEIFGHFNQLLPERDYVILEDLWVLESGLKIPVIRLNSPVGLHETLAISYIDNTGAPDTVGVSRARQPLSIPAIGKRPDTLLVKVIKPTFDKLVADPTSGDFDTTAAWYPTLPYELRNFYDLGARNISYETLKLTVRRRDPSLPVDPETVLDTPLIRMLGLDQRGPQNDASPDGKIDGNLIDEERGVLFFPDLNPFDPAGFPGNSCAPGYTGFNCLNHTGRPNLLLREPGDPDELANRLVYIRRTPDPSLDSRYYIDAEFRSSRQGFFLGRFNILEGSEQVKADGIPLKRGEDYDIDYDTGQITFRRLPGPDQAISVDYSFAPGVGQVQRTLLGFSTSYTPGANLSFSSSFLYESRGAQETNPKLGEEPATSMIGDLSTVLAFSPVWMTQLANQIPGIRTSQASALNVQGSFSASVPNPNTKGEAYLDDMEGNRESNTLSLNRTSWIWSGVPVGQSAEVANHALLEWYNARGVKENHLKPTLTNEEGGDNEHQVLEMNVKEPTGQVAFGPEDWTGITLPLSTVGQDFTKVQFMEIWVNDFTPDHFQTRGLLKINFGRVSEDAFWDPRNPPNVRLDTEDKNSDGRLDGGSKEFAEDTGLDGIFSEDELGYDASANPDPNGDDYRYSLDTAPNDFSRINNLERNGNDDPNARPDTEDLNRNGILDQDNNYFEATIDLADTHFVAIDVARLYAGDPDVKANNGWRLFRVPVDATFRRVGLASWDNIQAVRFWVDSLSAPIKLQIGGVELVGNRWLRQAILDSAMIARGVELEVRARNNKDDAGIYKAPYEVENQVGGTADRREQSLALGYKNLADGDTVLAFKTYSDAGSALGWTQYRELRFYVHGEPGVESQNLRVIARFGPDTLNYYEYSAPIRSGWQSVIVPMERLSSIKEGRSGERVKVDALTALDTGEVYAAVGNPSFTRIGRISFGLAVTDSIAVPAKGEVWINELRLADVRKEKGYSSNVSVQANFADLLAVNVSYQKQDQDYFRVGQGGNQGTGFDHTAIGFSSTLQADRFIPTSGVQLPIRFTFQRSTDVPKFRTGSDVVLDAARSDEETRELNRHSIDLSYRRTGPRKGITRYTLDAITAGLNYSQSGSINPQSSDSSWTFSSNVGYILPIGGGGFSIGRRLKINLLPETFNISSDWNSSRNVSYSRTLSDTADVLTLRSDAYQRILTLRGGTSYIPLPSVRVAYNLSSTRDMLLHQAGFFGLNKGTEIRHEQGVDLSYRPRWLTLLQPDFQFKGSYNEDASPDRRLAVTDPTNLKTITNGGSARVNFTIPLSRLGQQARRAPGGRDTSGTSLILAPFRLILSRMQDVQAGFDFSRGASVSRVVGDPGFLFKAGFTEIVDPDIRRLTNSAFSTSRRYLSRASTQFKPIQTLTFDIRGDHQLAFTDAVYGARRTSTLSWPDLKGRWSDLQRILQMTETMSSLALSSAYARRTEEFGPDGGLVEQRVSTTSFLPLLGWEASFRNGLRTTVTSTITNTTTTDDRVTGLLRERQSSGTTIQVNKLFPASKGIKLPGSKKRIKLPNDLNLGFTATLSSDLQVLRRARVPDNVESNFERLNVGSQTNYNFSQSISGGFDLAYRQSKDKKTDVTQRGITIAFNATFRF